MYSFLQFIRNRYYCLNYGVHIIEEYCKATNYRTVLDIGCGEGRDLSIARRAAKEDVCLYGVDFNVGRKPDLENMGIKPLILDLERDRLPIADCSIDLVIANQIYEHLKEIFWVSHEIARVLKAGGRIILGVPNLASFHNRLFLLFGKQPTCVKITSAHIRGYTKSGLQAFFSIGNFTLISFEASNFYPFPVFISSPLSKIFPNSAVAIFLLFEKQGGYNGEFIKYLEESKLETNFRTKPQGDKEKGLGDLDEQGKEIEGLAS